MRIVNSTISMASARTYSAEASETQTTITRRYDGDAVTGVSMNASTAEISQLEVEGGAALFQTSAEGMTRTDQGAVQQSSTYAKPEKGQAEAGQTVTVPAAGSWLSGYLCAFNSSPRMSFLRQLIDLLEQFTGRKFSRFSPEEAMGQRVRSVQVSASAAAMRYRQTAVMAGEAIPLAMPSGEGGGASVNGHWTRQTVRSAFVSGEECTAFRSSGTVVTADGRAINFGVSVEMSRSFEAFYLAAGREEVYTDPLVINLDTDAPALSDVSFRFDLNCDGTEEELAALEGSSGFLALDKNGDGEINDGSELFGARTGDGFGELARYDQDGNGWIDEGDEVFSRLSVWVHDGGKPQLLTLSEADVGAIFLGSQNTRFSLADRYGETGAMVRKTGVYLKESGQVGTVQHIDFKT